MSAIRGEATPTVGTPNVGVPGSSGLQTNGNPRNQDNRNSSARKHDHDRRNHSDRRYHRPGRVNDSRSHSKKGYRPQERPRVTVQQKIQERLLNQRTDPSVVVHGPVVQTPVVSTLGNVPVALTTSGQLQEMQRTIQFLMSKVNSSDNVQVGENRQVVPLEAPVVAAVAPLAAVASLDDQVSGADSGYIPTGELLNDIDEAIRGDNGGNITNGIEPMDQQST